MRRGPGLEPGLGDVIGQVREDTRAVVAAEIAAVKALVAWRLSGLKQGVPLLLGALFLVQAVLTALLVGLVLTLSPLIGAGLATLLVVVVSFAVVGLLAWLGARACGSLFATLPEDIA